MPSASGNGMPSFPDGFLLGAATAGHQVEGGNVNSDIWEMEWAKPSMFTEPSGDACDHYHRYPEDVATLASLGVNAYRFSVEWSRVEPEEGYFSHARPLTADGRHVPRARRHPDRHLQPLLRAALVLARGQLERPDGRPDEESIPRRRPSDEWHREDDRCSTGARRELAVRYRLTDTVSPVDKVVAHVGGFVFQFDGQVLELFGQNATSQYRKHIELMTEVVLTGPDKKGNWSLATRPPPHQVVEITLSADQRAGVQPVLDALQAAGVTVSVNP
jgi:hypothetical protein